jgi:hypothetical protein
MDSSGVQNAPNWSAGRQVITGVVIFTEFVYNRKFRKGSLKGELLLSDGRRLWTSLPDRPPEVLFEGEPWEVRTHHDVMEGDTLTMAVTVTPREDDATSGYGSRPKLQSFAERSADSDYKPDWVRFAEEITQRMKEE